MTQPACFPRLICSCPNRPGPRLFLRFPRGRPLRPTPPSAASGSLLRQRTARGREPNVEQLASVIQGFVSLVARLALMTIFLVSTVANKIPQFTQTVAYMGQEGVPIPKAALAGAIGLLLLGSLSLIVGAWTRIGAFFLLVFLCAATYYFHDFWTLSAPAATPDDPVPQEPLDRRWPSLADGLRRRPVERRWLDRPSPGRGGGGPDPEAEGSRQAHRPSLNGPESDPASDPIRPGQGLFSGGKTA